MNKKLLIILLLAVLALTACQSKVPDGVSKEFHTEMQSILGEMVKDVQNNKGFGFNIYEQSSYKKLMKMSNNSQYTGNEMYILDYTVTLYDYIGLYYDGMTEFKDDIHEIGDKICELMNIEFDISKLIK